MSGEQEICPAVMVDQATSDNAQGVLNELLALLTIRKIPEDFRNEIRARITDLHRRFPEQLLPDPLD